MTGTLQLAPTESSRAADAEPEGAAARVGSTIGGKYLLHRLLGEGGMGAVYEAENVVTQRRVAVKVMHAAAAQVGDAGERFLREARAAARVEHPNIVGVLDAGVGADGSRFIVQELLHGVDLRAELRARGVMPCDEALALLTPVMEALAAAHRAGVVHRDVKPENIFLCEGAGGRVPKLIDFGIARLRDGDVSLTRSGALMGTPGYMSPEQARGLRDIDARADVWAIAVVLREAITGERPFRGDNYNAMLASILTDTVPPTRSVAPRAPASVCAVIDRALERDPARRPRDVGELLDALRGDATVAPSAPPRSYWGRRRVAFAAGVALTAALAAMAAAWRSDTPARAEPHTPPVTSVVVAPSVTPTVVVAPSVTSTVVVAPSIAAETPSITARAPHGRVGPRVARRVDVAPSVASSVAPVNAPPIAPSVTPVRSTLIRDLNGQ